MGVEGFVVNENCDSVVSTLSITPSATLCTPATEMIIFLVLVPSFHVIRSSLFIVLSKFALGGGSTTLEMHTILTAPAIRTESRQIEFTEFLPHVSLVASGTLFAKAGIVVVT